jgi:hypothetical protein
MAGELPREAHNAPLHLFNASADLVGFGRIAYRRRPEKTGLVLDQLFEQMRGEGLAMAYTMEDFERDYIKKHLPRLNVREQEEVLQGLSAEVRLAGLPAEQIRRYLDQTAAGR